MKELIHKKVVVFLIGVLVGLSSLRTEPASGLKPYKIKSDLSNVSNLKEFADAIRYYGRDFSLTEEQRKKLVENGFVVIPSEAQQFFHIYESPHFGITPRIPNFITTDCVLHIYHLLYDFSLRAVEVEKLLPALRDLTIAMFEKSLELYERAKSSRLREACRRNVIFFGVAASLLKFEDLPLPKECASSVENELRNIREHKGRKKSSIFPFGHDYSQYKVRGHYTRSEELSRFFLAMTWYGQNAFPFTLKSESTDGNITAIQAMIMSWLLFNSEANKRRLVDLWDEIYSITSLYVGSSDDLNPHDLYELIVEVYGENVDIDSFIDDDKLKAFLRKARNLRKPRIVTELVGLPEGVQFRFMGKRYILDSYVLQRLSKWPHRPFPRGLDVMAVLGSRRAEEILDRVFLEPDKWKDYPSIRQKLKEEFSRLDEREWYKTLFSGWLYVIKALLKEWDDRYPSFMRNVAWTDKELNTSLASWVELRHDVVLYGKPSGAEGGDGGQKIPQPKGYVEPVPEFYRRLLKLVKLNAKILRRYNCLTERLDALFKRYEDLVTFLKIASEKELKGEILSYDEFERIRYIGNALEELSTSLIEIGLNLPSLDWKNGNLVYGNPVHLRGWFEVMGPDRDMACIVDVHTSEDECLEEAVGHANTIYVVVPIGDKLYLTRGAVFSYYEFKYPVSHRLTDEAWQEMIERWRAPDPPPWTASFLAH
ncbi:MAG: hypothetical protein DRQ06_06700 [Candidatus Hydrothermota bacterium]|nr:MAG: hypothetical protein DRQ06_06700 [Candidatus Hydrothermae bacterium]